MSHPSYDVAMTHAAKEMLKSIGDRRIQAEIMEAAQGLTFDPSKKGKPLVGELKGYWSLRAAAQRYRIIYQIQDKRVLVIVVAVGIRKDGSRRDIYELAQKMVRLGLA